MLFKTKRIEIDINRANFYLALTIFGCTFATFQDFSGQGLSAINWYRASQTNNPKMEIANV